MTPLMAAAYWNTPKVVQSLLKAGANIHARDKDGKTALMWSVAGTKYPEVIAALLDAGANIRTKDKDGRKALDFARMNKKLKNEGIIDRLKRNRL